MPGSSVTPVHYLPIATTAIAATFSLALWRKYRRRPSPHLWWWAVGVACYGLGTLIEATITLTGNSVFLTKAWYVAGAILGGYPLAQGSLFLSYSRRFARRATAVSLPLVIVASLLVWLSPVVPGALEPHRPSGAVLAWRWVRLLTPFINTYAAFFLIGGAVMSAWRFWRQGDAGNRAIGNSLIALGALMPGIGGSMAKAGTVEALYVGEFVGLLVMWAGERACARRRASALSRIASQPAGARSLLLAIVLLSAAAAAAAAGEIAGTTADSSGLRLPAARISVLNMATGKTITAESDGSGQFRVPGLLDGTYRVAVSYVGFSNETRTVTLAPEAETATLDFVLRPGDLTTTVTVTATRGERGTLDVPQKTDAITRDDLVRTTPNSTGDALVQAPGITPVGSGPYGVRPRLRGLDSTRVLVLVDGERLNNARTATDRAGTDVGLIDVQAIDDIDVVSGAGSVLYGTDALAGTINILTAQPSFSDTLRFTYGLDGLFSSNEHGRRGAVTLGFAHRRVAGRIVAGAEDYDNYRTGKFGVEDTRPLYASGTLHEADTIDDNFGFRFNAFPDPFNAPYVRTDREIPTSAARGDSLNAGASVALTSRQTLDVKYLRRRMHDVGFPDFAAPYFFQRVSLPFSNLDRISARYEVMGLAPWFTNLRVSGYYQDQGRLLRNELPVQFPVPSPGFFPINVFRLNVLSDTEQRVRTPGLDAQGTFLVRRSHVITAGTMVYTDRSRDARQTTTETTIIGNVALGARGPQANVFASPVQLGPATITHPVRVPDASFRDVGVFVQDEWRIAPRLTVVGGLRYDNYSVNTEATPGYDIGSLIRGAEPALDPASLPSLAGDRVSRSAMTGNVGLVFRATEATTLQAHYGRSYRHANLEELLFSGTATVGAIVPNLRVSPETGDNVDVGLRRRTSRYEAAIAYFNNSYNGFISTEIVANTPAGPISQAINFADVRIQGVEGDAEVSAPLRGVIITPFGNFAYTYGSVLRGENRLTGTSLAGTPQDNITPFKSTLGIRVADRRDRLWAEYGARVQTDVKRVATTLRESPFLIAQDLLGLAGFTVQRLAMGVNLAPGGNRLGFTLAVENLADRFYREQFQFAPARGRSITLAMHVRGK